MYLFIRHKAAAIEICIFKPQSFEIWWNKKVSTMSKLAHAKPDLANWGRNFRKSFTVDNAFGLEKEMQPSV